MATYGKKGESKESEESWTHYIERLEQYFLANEVDEAGKKQAILLSVCGSKTYALARDLLQPVRPAEATFKKIVDTLDKHFSPRPSEIVERFKFHSRNRNRMFIVCNITNTKRPKLCLLFVIFMISGYRLAVIKD